MEEWLRISLQLCVFGFFNGISPASHFMFKYLTEFRGIDGELVTSFYMAQGTYWHLGMLAFFFLITDMMRYKPLIILSAISAILYYVVVRWTVGLYPLIGASFLSAVGASTDIAYFTYIYAKVNRDKYQQVTSNTRSAALFGRCLGAVCGQLFMMYDVMTVEEMMYINLTCRVIAFFVALTLPPVETSIYFYQAKKKEIKESPKDDEKFDEKAVEFSSTVDVLPGSTSPEEDQELAQFSWTNAKSLLWSHFKSAYSNKTVRLWSVWWALLQTGFRMVYAYNQPLWAYMAPGRQDIYNGFAETGLTLFSALGSLLAGLLDPVMLEKWAVTIVIVFSLAQGSFTLVTGLTSNLFVSYAFYTLLGAVYYFMITVCSSIVARNLVRDSFGLIFGINTWLALLFTFIFTLVVVSTTFFTLNPVEQYRIYGIYHYALGLLFMGYGGYKLYKKWRKGKAKAISG